jgi:hypothetical protein
MNWAEHHGDSERLASEAGAAIRRGDLQLAAELFGSAAQAEVKALATLGPDKPRTLGITAVSAVALLYKAGELNEAERLAHHVSTLPGLPAFAIDELHGLLQAIGSRQAQQTAKVAFADPTGNPASAP